MPRAETLIRLTALTVVFAATLLLPVTSSCQVAGADEAVSLDKPTLTLNWSFDEPRCDLTLTGRVTEQGRLRFSAKLACPVAMPSAQRVSLGSTRL